MDIPNWPGKKILVAEDVETNFLLVQAILKKTEVTLYWAMNGIEAMEYIDSKKPDLLLLDIRMPGMDGYEVLAEMRKKKIDIPVVALTAYALREDELRIKEAGFDAYITKPIKSKLLIETIDTYFSKMQ